MGENFTITNDNFTFYTEDPRYTNYNFKKKGETVNASFGEILIKIGENNVDFSGLEFVNYYGSEFIDFIQFNSTEFDTLDHIVSWDY